LYPRKIEPWQYSEEKPPKAGILNTLGLTPAGPAKYTLQVTSEPIVSGDEIPQTSKPAPGMTSKVVKGTLWTMVGVMIPIFFSLFTTPIVARLLGAEGYGLFVLVLLIPAYFSFADFGMNVASTKFASEAFAEGSPEREARIVRTSALIAFVSSLPFAVAMILLSGSIVRVFNVPEARTGEATFALKLAGLIFVLNFLNSIFNTPELARLRMDLNILITYGGRLAGIIATPIVVYLGGGVIGAVAVALCASFLILVGHLAASVKLLPEMIGFSIDRTAIRPLVKFGSSLMVAFIAGALLTHLEKFVLTRATSVETLAYYSVAASLAGMLGLFSGSMAQSLMPAFSQLQGEGNRPALNALYSRGVRLTLIWLVPAVVFMILVGQPFFTYWFSPDFGRESTGPFYLIVAGFFFTVLSYFPYTVVMASGRSDVFAKIYWAELVPYLLLVWWLAHRYGAAGAALAWSLRAFLDAALLFMLARKVSGVSYAQRNVPQFLAAVAVMLIPLAALVYFRELNLPVIAISLAAAAVYALIVWARVVETEEIAWLKNRIGVYFSK
jgi:O-antigen/teichoic acid export membrane protein